MWPTWLAYFGLIFGIIGTAIFGVSLVRSAAIGVAAAVALVIVWNVAAPAPPCLQNSKGWDILRAYTLC
jgi:hypothetical protein